MHFNLIFIPCFLGSKFLRFRVQVLEVAPDDCFWVSQYVKSILKCEKNESCDILITYLLILMTLLNPFMTEAVIYRNQSIDLRSKYQWTGFYMITASVMEGLSVTEL